MFVLPQIAQRLRLNRPLMAHLPAARGDWALGVESSSIALKQQAVAARASAWARTIEKLRERQMALKHEERQGPEVHHDE
jgi:hypothetical protein